MPLSNANQEASSDNNALHLVVIGASAGGLESLEQLFQHVPRDLKNISFLIVQHLLPEYGVGLEEILSRLTNVAIEGARSGQILEPGKFYVSTVAMNIVRDGTVLTLVEANASEKIATPIDYTATSAAEVLGDRCICVILSGTGTDGAVGAKAVAGGHGLVIVETPESAKHDKKPSTAISTGVVDIVVSPIEIGDVIQSYANSLDRDSFRQNLKADGSSNPYFKTIIEVLNKEFGVDFSEYKTAMIARRIHRRQVLNSLMSPEDYVAYFIDRESEQSALFNDLLIDVTNFFRDTAAFNALRDTLRVRLIGEWKGDSLRAWVCGCSTGEEAYSLAILLHELQTDFHLKIDFKIFATDIDPRAIELASRGVFSADKVAFLSPERLARYFIPCTEGFRVTKEIRQLIVFARHNVLSDAPFLNLNLVLCRNLLIYMKPIAQQKVISVFHFALQGTGILMLGQSETIGAQSEEFRPLVEDKKLFQRKYSAKQSLSYARSFPFSTVDRSNRMQIAKDYTPQARISTELLHAYDQLLAMHMPPALLINQTNQLVQIFGDCSKYLSLRAGRLTNSLLDMLDDDLRLAVSSAITNVRSMSEKTSRRTVRCVLNGELRAVTISVSPVFQPTESLFLLVKFEASAEPIETIDPTSDLESLQTQSDHVSLLEMELKQTKLHLQSTIEEIEASNEELQATIEELVASNEELQSTNEELQSVNEELFSVNREYQRKIEELLELSADMDSLLASTEIHMIFLDSELRIRRFTPQSAELFNLRPTDIGRNFSDFSNRIGEYRLIEEMHSVLTSGDSVQKEVTAPDNQTMLFRILPHRVSNKISGVVFTLVNIEHVKAQQRLIRQMFEVAPHGMLLVDRAGKIILSNPAAAEITDYADHELEGMDVDALVPESARKLHFKLRNSYWKNPVRRTMGQNIELHGRKKNGTMFPIEIGLSPITTHLGTFVLVSLVDITPRKIAAAKIAESERELRDITNSVPAWIAYIDDKLHLRFVNEQFSALWDVSREEIVGRHLGEFLDAGTFQQFEASILKSLSGNSVTFAQILTNRYGQKFWGSIRLVPDSHNGQVRGVFATIVDITELKEAQARYERVIKATNEGIYDWPIDSDRFFGSARFWELAGCPGKSGESHRDDFHSRIHPDEVENILQQATAHIDGELPLYHTEFRVRQANGEYSWVESRGVILENSLGTTTHFTGAIGSINNRKILELALREQVANRDRFLAVLSHELRNPIGAISNAAHILRHIRDAVEIDRNAQLIDSQVKHMRRLLDDLLEVSRYLHDKMSIHVATVQVDRLLRHAVESSIHEAMAKQIDLSFDNISSTVIVIGDYDRLLQCILNVLSNAVRYTPAGGLVEVRATTKNDYAIISVKDNGIGMTAETQKHVFDLFCQATDSIHLPNRGLGIGLFLVQRIAKLHNGCVHVESEGLGRGTKVEIVLPLVSNTKALSLAQTDSQKQQSSENTQTPNPAAEQDGNSDATTNTETRTIVLVDDLKAGRTVLAYLLRQNGFNVLEAESGEAALQMICEQQPSFALIDIGLPDMRGDAIARRIRSERLADSTFLFAVTGFGQSADRESFTAAGFDELFIKPVDLTQLLKSLKSNRKRIIEPN